MDESELREFSRIPYLDSFRLVAVGMVFFGHSALAPQRFPGYLGVSAFFFLSGFLITTLLRKELEQTNRLDVRAFYKRRAARLIPPSLLVLCITAAVSYLGNPTDPQFDLIGFAASAVPLTNLHIVALGRDGLVPHTSHYWSLAVEEHFYLVVPLLFARRHGSQRPRFLLPVLVLAVAVCLAAPWRAALALSGASFDRLYVSTDTRIDLLAGGCLLALLANPLSSRPKSLCHRIWSVGPWLPAGAGLLILISATAGKEVRLVLADAIQIPLFATLFIWYLHPERLAPKPALLRALDSSGVRTLGKLTYSIYLWHKPVLAASSRVSDSAVISTVIAAATTVALSWATTALVEQPIRNSVRKGKNSD